MPFLDALAVDADQRRMGAPPKLFPWKLLQERDTDAGPEGAWAERIVEEHELYAPELVRVERRMSLTAWNVTSG